jgi:hypothetical protein
MVIEFLSERGAGGLVSPPLPSTLPAGTSVDMSLLVSAKNTNNYIIAII